MEWLSHTQKKHCELCKTSFRFTKLYHPGMPSRIPTTVFLRRAALHVANMLLTWCRAMLVACVWLLLLPWCMRVVWRSLFWVGDGGWSQEVFMGPIDLSNATVSSPFGLGEGLDAALGKLVNSSTQNSPPSSIATAPANETSFTDSLFWKIAWVLVVSLSGPLMTFGMYETNHTQTVTNATIGTSRNPSLLSDVPLFHWFHSHTANRFIIDVLEGQIITLLVVVAFILVFLIREWVVQQQPVINMVALGNNAAAPEIARQEQEPPIADVDDEDVDSDDDMEPDEDDAAAVEAFADIEDVIVDEEQVLPRPRRASSSRRRREELMRKVARGDIPDDLRTALKSGSADEVSRMFVEMGLVDLNTPGFEGVVEDYIRTRRNDSQPQPSGNSSEPSSSRSVASVRTQEHTGLTMEEGSDEQEQDSSSLQRPLMPSRDRSFIATGIRRSLEEGNDWSFESVPQVSRRNSAKPPDNWDGESGRPHETSNQETSSDPEQDSEHSSESWQQVSDTIMGPDSDQVLEGEGSHGAAQIESGDDKKQKATNDTSLSHANNEGLDSPEVEDRSSDESEFDPAELEELEQLLREHEDAVAEDLPQVPANVAEAEVVPQPVGGALNHIMDWIFGDIAPAGLATEENANDEQIVRNIADEPPFVPFAANQPQPPADPPAQDAEVAAAAAQAGIDVNDQEAIEDAEDLEGILELVGMQGPLIGLVQNAVFSAVLISASLASAVWIPYLIGKVAILIMGSPIALLIKLPLRVIATLTDLFVDLVLIVAAGFSYWMAQFASAVISLYAKEGGSVAFDGRIATIAASTRNLVQGAFDRIAVMFTDASLSSSSDYGRLSINSHAALRSLQNSTSTILNETSDIVTAAIEKISLDSPLTLLWRASINLPNAVVQVCAASYRYVSSVVSWLWTSKTYKITLDLDLSHTSSAASYTDLERWTATDRLIAIFAGYGCFAIAGAVYLRRGSPISNSQQGQRIEMIISEILQQAGGVLKVILIISIEMLAFPLYCGLLLDLAMLPLFKNATLFTRWQFAQDSPWTSGFVHWFIGTCYMFHFALFVSMCRKIMRKGVLYFIRDPDDPTFHPVRDVLERSVTTQLRKIAFSALVYGALVIVCLGGVVWSLSRVTTNVLPIHWTTEAPSLEFPLDLLFYNFLTPIIIKFYKPSEGLHSIYKWWFKRCAGLLNLSNFLFGENLEQHKDQAGKYVRAPASDQARIPKGQAVFIEVDKENVRKDGKNEGGVHNNMELVTMVFIPGWFRVRIFAFVVTIWIFMGLSGVSVTIMPLLFGRFLFSLILPPSVEMNDIHAFSLGVYTLGSIIYSGYHLYRFISSLDRPAISPTSTLNTIINTVSHVGLRVLRFTYVWISLIFLIPTMFAILIELYFLMPLHAYLGPKEPHVVHIIQDWTLGFLYARLAARLVLANRNSRPARAFNAVIRDGYMYPNARIATRCFVIPVVSLWLIAIAVPGSLAWTMIRTMYTGADEQVKNMVWRYSFPAVGMSLCGMWTSRELLKIMIRWKLVVRDEVYLIGERLHNFGERKAGQQGRGHEEDVRRRAGEERVEGVVVG